MEFLIIWILAISVLWSLGITFIEEKFDNEKELQSLKREITSLKVKNRTLNRAYTTLKTISDQGFWSSKMAEKDYLVLLDEYKEVCDKTLSEIDIILRELK